MNLVQFRLRARSFEKEPSSHFSGSTYAEGVIASSPGLQCEASYPGLKQSCSFYAESVVAKTFPVGNNPFRVRGCWGTTLTQGSSLRIATLIVGKSLIGKMRVASSRSRLSFFFATFFFLCGKCGRCGKVWSRELSCRLPGRSGPSRMATLIGRTIKPRLSDGPWAGFGRILRCCPLRRTPIRNSPPPVASG